MIEIRNLTFQPLTLQLAGAPGGLHLGPRGRKPIPDAQLSAEMRTAAKRGFISVQTMDVATPVVEPVVESPDDAQSKKRR